MKDGDGDGDGGRFWRRDGEREWEANPVNRAENEDGGR